MHVQFTVPGKIVPWARAGKHGSRQFTPKPQRDFAATIKSLARDAMGEADLIDGPVELKIMAVWPWPTSMSAKKRQRPGAEIKQSKPDSDNVVKLIKDALNLVVWTDDARVADLHFWKRYGDRPGLVVEIQTLGEAA